ncbi:MAG: acetyl-CoA C-acetyltransferase, partial [Gammaproteobacteria bacterium]|nr:acetyl-CoA C-acetyltransferase [Gammaproteobacteria bacterium]
MATSRSRKASDTNQAQKVFVVDGARTPFLKARTGPGPFRPSDLAVHAGRALLARQPFEPPELDEVILGCIMPGPEEANIARVVSLRLGCGDRVPAWTVQRNCATGMQAIDSAARSIASGRAKLVLAGGSEAMSHAPILWGPAMTTWLARWMTARSAVDRVKVLTQLRPAFLKPIVALLVGLTDPVVGLSMGQTAEVISRRYGISREEMDAYAVRSHLRLAAAQAEGRLGEIVPLIDDGGQIFDQDDGVRPDSSVEKLAKLKPFFDREFGNVTPGNSSQITDGAAWVVLASAAAVKQYDLPVLGCLVDSQWAALDPRQMGFGPVNAAVPMLKRRRLGLAKIDYWEINEAFAGQVLACLRAFNDDDYCREELGRRGAMGEIDQERLNVDGGAVALGHPVGSSGARIVLHLLKVLEQREAKRGVAAICIGGGQGGAMLLERV